MLVCWLLERPGCPHWLMEERRLRDSDPARLGSLNIVPRQPCCKISFGMHWKHQDP